MAAGTYNLTIEQGATFTATVTWSDAANALVNLTGYTARMQLRATLASATPAIELTNANGRIVLGGAAGTIDLTIAAADTALLGAGSYVYDLELVSATGVVTRLIQGTATSVAEVTR